MSYEMRTLRKEDLSLYLYIKDVVLREFIEEDELIALEEMPELCSLTSYVYEAHTAAEPTPNERGRGWVYFDEPEFSDNCAPFTSVSGVNGVGDDCYGTPEQSERVFVYETSSSGTLDLVDPSEYMIDYIDGRIITERRLNTPYVTYYWNYVSVVDEWAAIEASDPPVIVIDIQGTDKMGYQLGGGKRSVRKVDIHIFASHPAERNDISEVLYDGLFNRSCSLYDFPTGSVLDYDGTFYGRRVQGTTPNKLTYLFDRRTVNNVSRLQFDKVVARHVNLPLVMTRGRDEIMLSDLNAYRSKVSFEMFSYDDRSTGRLY
jgi:hypothetical protein